MCRNIEIALKNLENSTDLEKWEKGFGALALCAENSPDAPTKKP